MNQLTDIKKIFHYVFSSLYSRFNHRVNLESFFSYPIRKEIWLPKVSNN